MQRDGLSPTRSLGTAVKLRTLRWLVLATLAVLVACGRTVNVDATADGDASRAEDILVPISDTPDAREDEGPSFDTWRDVVDVPGEAVEGSDAGADASCPASAPVRCGDVCTADTASNPSRCGATCEVCPAPPSGGAAACAVGACVIRCNAGLVEAAGECVDAPAPRPLRPTTNATVSVMQPLLHWYLPSGVDGAHVTICRDRACSRIVTEVDATGTSLRVPDLGGQGVYYWRLQPIANGGRGTARSATWQFRNASRDAPVEWSAAPHIDANGDGFDDVAFSTAIGPGIGAWFYPGGATIGTPITLDGGDGESFIVNLGDVNGDGFSDLGLATSLLLDTRFEVHLGGPTGPSVAPGAIFRSSVMTPSDEPRLAMGPCHGDFEGDGYADVVATAPNGHIVLMRGAPDGLRPAVLLGGSAWYVAADYDSDGFDDLVRVRATDALHTEIALQRGGTAGLGSPTSISLIDGLLDGRGFVATGDMTGDGYPDVALSLRTPGSTTSSVLLIAGQRGDIRAFALAAINDRVVVGSVGDIDSDGFADLALRASTTPPSIDVCRGGSTGFSAGACSTQFPAPSASERFGHRFSDLGDVNGDGFEDVGIAAPGWPEATGLGRVYVYWGLPRGFDMTPTTLDGLTPYHYAGSYLAHVLHRPVARVVWPQV